MERILRLLPIRGRILSIAALNTAVVFFLTLLILDGAKQLNSAWAELLEVRRKDQVLASVGVDSARLQSLIHRYFTQSDADLLVQIEFTRRSLIETLASSDNPSDIGSSSRELATYTNRLITGFERLRSVRQRISEIYDGEVLKLSREIASLYAILESTLRGNTGLIVPALSKSRETFSNVLVAANGYYLTFSANSAQEAFSGIESIERTLPVMRDLADSDLQRNSLQALEDRINELRTSLLRLSSAFDEQSTLLREDVDRSQQSMSVAAAQLSREIKAREVQVQDQLDLTLSRVYWQIAVLATGALIVIAIIGTAIARSISGPLDRLMASMDEIVSGHLHLTVQEIGAPDELGTMARAMEIFRRNAIAKRLAEDEVRASHARIEAAYAELRQTQQSLVESEKLAALGGLVAGVAHEVNNPVGISITVASTLAKRISDFEKEVQDAPLRRSRLNEFTHSSKDAAEQLVANLTRAGDLIRSFKQVAADRSHAERRTFDLLATTYEIIASLKPSLSKREISLNVDGDEGIVMDSYPGLVGQVLTNLFLNALAHAFADGASGAITVRIQSDGPAHASILFRDNGKGMDEATRKRAFDPFFTTTRGTGGTGLGLHIAYSAITQQLGGTISLDSDPKTGTSFRIHLPRVAPHPDDLLS
jgi:signal transduction histidine kinase